MQEFAEYLALFLLLAACLLVAVNWTYVRRRFDDIHARSRRRRPFRG